MNVSLRQILYIFAKLYKLEIGTLTIGYEFLELLKDKPCFSGEDMHQAMQQSGETVREAAFRARIQRYLKKSLIVRIGRNAYELPSNKAIRYSHSYSMLCLDCVQAISIKHPYLNFSVFESIQLNEFINHLIGQNTVFIGVEGGTEDFVFETLKGIYPGRVLLGPTPEILHRYWLDGQIVIEKLITEAPHGKPVPWQPKLEKILVDLMSDSLLRSTVSESELPGVFQEAFSNYAIDESQLFRYARRRNADFKIKHLIQNSTSIKLKTEYAMLSPNNFNKAHIDWLSASIHRDPILIERTLYAFGLLEAISSTGLPFIFKGGTSLMLLLEHPRRLSTDIDILVDPEVNVDEFLRKASNLFPFTKFTEQVRIGNSKIKKRHFKFAFDSPESGKESFILLDIVYGHSQYTKIINKEITNEFLQTDSVAKFIQVPSIDCMLADKLTAFAPHTIGIPLKAGKVLISLTLILPKSIQSKNCVIKGCFL